MHHHLKNQERALNLSILISSGPGAANDLTPSKFGYEAGRDDVRKIISNTKTQPMI